MTDKGILIKALQKAGLGGSANYISEIPEGEIDYNTYIFDHLFAKAFWGMEKTDWENIDKKDNWWEWQDCEYWTGNEAEFIGERWQYHLQTMVLEEYPVKYLEKFL